MEEKQRLNQPLQHLYDSEINFSIMVFWDNGFEVKLGDEWNGFRAEGNVKTWEEAEAWLIRQATAHYPNSVFASKYRDGLSWEQAVARQKTILGTG